LGLVGCGGGDDDDATPTTGAGQTPQPTPTADPTKAQEVQGFLWPREDTSSRATKGEIFQAYTTADVTNLDPLASPSFTAKRGRLVGVSAIDDRTSGFRVPANGEVQGYLAQSFEFRSRRGVVFKLHPNAVWQTRRR